MVSYRSGPKVKTFFEGEIFFMPRDWVLRDRVLGSWISVWAMRAESKIISGKFLGFFLGWEIYRSEGAWGAKGSGSEELLDPWEDWPSSFLRRKEKSVFSNSGWELGTS
jgi:hypothetical protein